MADLKTKDLAQRLSHRCFSTSFMKFRGPEALKGRWDEKAGLRGMRYAPNVRRARGAIEKETGYEKD